MVEKNDLLRRVATTEEQLIKMQYQLNKMATISLAEKNDLLRRVVTTQEQIIAIQDQLKTRPHK